MNLSVILDGAGKAAAGLGIVLGMSYISGLFKMSGFYGAFHADWLFDMIDVQAYISEGLPLTSLFLIVFIAQFFGLKKVQENHRGWYILALAVTSSVVGAQVVLLLVPSVSYYMLAGMFIGASGSAFAAWIAHDNIFPSRSAVDLYHMVLVLALILGLSPYLVGKARAEDVKKAREETTEVIDAGNRVVGVLVRVVSGKYLVLDCNVQGQLSFYEISPSLKLRRSSGKCSAYL